MKIKKPYFHIHHTFTSYTERSFIGKWRCYDLIYLADKACFKKCIEERKFAYTYEEKKAKLFFFQTHSTVAWATTKGLKNNQSVWNWNWSANPQYSVPFIDDWTLPANGGSNTRYYLVKAKSNEPKYLLAIRKFCGHYLVNMYKSNSLNNKEATTFENNGGEIPNLLNGSAKPFELGNDIEISPIPIEGKLQILSSKSDITSIVILDSRGQAIYTKEYNSQNRVEIDLSNHSEGIYFVKLTDSQNSVSNRKIILNK